MQRVILTILYCFSITLCQAQGYTNNWYFGDSAGVSFSSGNPQYILGCQLYSEEAGSSISDSAGNLLFYSGGPTIWNKNNQVMDGGQTENMGGIASYTQGVLILNKPGSSHELYMINRWNGNGALYLAYSLIDMNQNNGLGKVVERNDTLLKYTVYPSFTEKLTAVRHGNGKDWWIFLHQQTTNEFFSYLLDSSGFHGPYSQNIGITPDLFDYAGEMVFDPSGNHLAAVWLMGRVDYFNFDRCTGHLSNYISIMDTDLTNSSEFKDIYGCEFSPNGKLIYVSAITKLYQFQIDSISGQITKHIIWQSPDTILCIGQLQLGPDNKIYTAGNHATDWPPKFYDSTNEYLHTILQPDSPGLACNFQLYNVYLGGKRNTLNLPNLPNYSLGALPSYQSSAGPNKNIFIGDSAQLGTAPVTGIVYSWQPAVTLSNPNIAQPFASPSVTTQYVLTVHDTSGTYSCATREDTVMVTVKWHDAIDGINQSAIKIYPNPASDYIIALSKSTPSADGETLRIEFYDLLGKQILSVPLLSEKQTISTKDFAAGVYFYRVTSGNRILRNGKLVVE